MNLRKFFDPSVYFVLDPSLCLDRDVLEIANAALMGGASMIQLRDKISSPKEIKSLGLKILELTRAAKVPLLINDHLEIAHEIDADGVHLGQGDSHPRQARDILGPQKLIGLTAFRPEHFAALDSKDVDYAGTGPFFETKTDKGKPLLGAAGFAPLVKLSKVPVVGIGGITPQNAAQVMAAGASGVAAMRSISMAADPHSVTAELKSIVENYRLKRAS